jgi:hypothetical protein
VMFLCCQVEVSATSWSLVQRIPTDCGASLCVITKLRGRGGHSPRWAAEPEKIIIIGRIWQWRQTWLKCEIIFMSCCCESQSIAMKINQENIQQIIQLKSYIFRQWHDTSGNI